MWAARHPPRWLRQRIVPLRNLFLVIGFLLCLEIYIHQREFHVERPSKPLDQPFSIGCRTPDVNASRENAVIVMLARNSDRDGALKTVTSFERQFNRWFHYPMVFLNDQPWDPSFVNALAEVASGDIQFKMIPEEMWGFPSWMDQDEARFEMKKQAGQGIMYAGTESYHHMCRFYSGKFYDHEALEPYELYWRLEPDVQFLCAITYDPFTAMVRSGKKYGFAIALWELSNTAPGLFRAVSEYKNAHSISSTPMWKAMIDASWVPWPFRLLLRPLKGRNSEGDAWNWCHFWSNFEIGSLDWLRSRQYRQLFKYLDEQQGFYYERWGDAPVHSFAAAMLLQPGEVHHFEDIGYWHGDRYGDRHGFQSCPQNAQGIQIPDSVTIGGGLWDPEVPDGTGCRCTCAEGVPRPPPTCLNKFERVYAIEPSIW